MSCIKVVKAHGDELFGKRGALLSLWQTIAENFYPQRADFTSARNLGDELAAGLMTSYPVIACRDLGNSFGAMLRPTAKNWFKIRTNRPDSESLEDKQWLEWATGYQKNMMYGDGSGFSRATKEADMDFAAFGQACLSVEVNRQGSGALYRCWHLRDVAWAEDESGRVTTVHRKWKPTVSDLVRLFPKTVHPKVKDRFLKAPYAEVNVRHVIMPSDAYNEIPGVKQVRQPYVSIYIDCDHDHEMEAVGSWTSHYVIPRWSTVSGSQYAHSPAVVAALPDARLIQQVTRVLLEAGEKATNPPMLAVQEAIRGDVSIYAGGITWVDAEYDERLGEVLRPMSSDKSGMQFGMDWAQDLRAQLAYAFYLSKLNLPPVGGPDMTAYEVGQRVQEFIRNTLPLFEPLEQEYNGQLCNISFEILKRNANELRASVPLSIAKRDIEFQFESPLRDAVEKLKVGQFMEAAQVLATAIQMDPDVALLVDNQAAARDTLGAVVPAKWLRSEEDVKRISAKRAQEVQTQQLLATMQQGADVAKTIHEAGPTAGLGGAGGAQ
jgi:hypothetical protein